MNRTGFAALFAFALMIGGGWVAKRAEPELVEKAGDGAMLESMEGSAAASVFGQFRTNLSGYLWIKIDEYIHGGVAMRPLSDEELTRSDIRRAGHAEGAHEGTREEHNETTAVPEAERDFRGWLGHVERNTQPFFDVRSHKHHDPREALPLFRFATWSDPRFIKGYVVGASVIARDPRHLDKALEYLREGERNNPGSVEIKTELARFYAYHKHEFRLAIELAEQAIRAEKGLRFKSEDTEEALLNAFRWRALCWRKLGGRNEERVAVAAGLARYPDDPVLLKMSKRIR